MILHEGSQLIIKSKHSVIKQEPNQLIRLTKLPAIDFDLDAWGISARVLCDVIRKLIRTLPSFVMMKSLLTHAN